MHWWLVEPRDPLVFGDGKPFTAVPGARARSLPFPYPSTLAGAVRTRAGSDRVGRFDTARIRELLERQVLGPFLVTVTGDRIRWLFPAPADALLLPGERSDRAQRLWLRPANRPPGTHMNLPKGLVPVMPARVERRKPLARPPAFWYWETYVDWLKAPGDDEIAPERVGIVGPGGEARVHVSIEPASQTAREGALFQTGGLEFWHRQEEEALHATVRLALAVGTDAEIQPGLGFLGGERRVAFWEPLGREPPPCPDEICRAVAEARACRLILVTPGDFDNGFLPAWVIGGALGVRGEIVAAAVPRFRPVSGWDYAKNQPKPPRKLAPAGSVFFLRLKGSREEVAAFVRRVWLSPISDDDRARRDGFGVAVVGAWDGTPDTVEV